MRIDHVRVLPEPSQPCATREIALENGAGVDIRLSTDRSTKLRLEPAMQILEPGRHDGVVVVPSCVTGYGSAWLSTAIAQADYDSADGAGNGQPRVAALRRPSREIVH